jgi:hypothetical protein
MTRRTMNADDVLGIRKAIKAEGVADAALAKRTTRITTGTYRRRTHHYVLDEIMIRARARTDEYRVDMTTFDDDGQHDVDWIDRRDVKRGVVDDAEMQVCTGSIVEVNVVPRSNTDGEREPRQLRLEADGTWTVVDH